MVNRDFTEVRPYVHKILVVIEPLLIDEDYFARVEGPLGVGWLPGVTQDDNYHGMVNICHPKKC